MHFFFSHIALFLSNFGDEKLCRWVCLYHVGSFCLPKDKENWATKYNPMADSTAFWFSEFIIVLLFYLLEVFHFQNMNARENVHEWLRFCTKSVNQFRCWMLVIFIWPTSFTIPSKIGMETKCSLLVLCSGIDKRSAFQGKFVMILDKNIEHNFVQSYFSWTNFCSHFHQELFLRLWAQMFEVYL